MKVCSCLFGLSLLLLFAACAPAASDPGRVEVAQLTEPLSFYPQQTGATWQYLGDGERLDALPIYSRVEGPTVIGGQTLIASRLVGRGIDNYAFRSYTPGGVFLYRETQPGTIITYDPPRQELPAERDLRVGTQWGGESAVEVVFPGARVEDRQQSLRLEYQYRVVDRRSVTVVAGTFEVFVINLEARQVADDGTLLSTLRREIWFTPYVGEVRTRDGFYLVETNFAGRSAAR